MARMVTLFSCFGVVFLIFFQSATAYPLEEHYGYIDVRDGAHMFYVIYENDAPQGGLWTDYPLIMWLQGGPGSSGVGYGNFWELGPWDINYNLRPGRWSQLANLLFVDQPVGTGYSYVDQNDLFTTTNQEIALDLLEFTKQLFELNPDLKIMPFFVFAESYGGKMAVDFALVLDQAIKDGDIVCNFKGIAPGDSWISPMDSVNTWAPFLYSLGYVNTKERQAVADAAASTQEAVDSGDWLLATNRWGQAEAVVAVQTGGINFYNVFAEEDLYSGELTATAKKSSKRNLDYMDPSTRTLFENHVEKFQSRSSSLEDFMNGIQKERWDIPEEVTWAGQSDMVFSELREDFMKPVVDSVSMLLNNTNIRVDVFTGDWDLICDTPGTFKWIKEMSWDGKTCFMDDSRRKLHVSTYDPQAGYVQECDQFSLFTLLRCGHMAPIDQPELALKMINEIFGFAGITPTSKKKKKDLRAEKMKLVHELEEFIGHMETQN